MVLTCSYCVFTSPLQSVATSNHHAPDLTVTAALNQSWLRNFLIRFIPPDSRIWVIDKVLANCSLVCFLTFYTVATCKGLCYTCYTTTA